MKNWVFALVALLVLVGCEQQTTNTLKESEIMSLDQQLLPNSEWQLSRSVIELSFCRDRVNEDLLASESELRGWRGSGEPTAFPPYRDEGLEKLQNCFLTNKGCCGKKKGISALSVTMWLCLQTYQKANWDAVFPLVAFLSSEQVCHVAVDDSY